MAINGGAASTTSRNVTLNLSAADAQTGVDGMQVSVDGIIDTEPVQPFSATKAVTLPAGSRNQEGDGALLQPCRHASLDASDTINLGPAGPARDHDDEPADHQGPRRRLRQSPTPR